MANILADRLGTDGYPAYVRKLDKRSSWGDASDQDGDRLVLALANVFPKSQPRFSVFLVCTDEDLKRVVVGLNLFRDRPNNQVDLIAFTEEEVAACGIDVIDTPGGTDCSSANKSHADLHSVQYDAYSDLCTMAFNKARLAFRITKGEAKSFASELMGFGCEAFDGNDDCFCIEVS